MSILVGATSACAGAAGQGGAGFTIDQSLRFRGGQALNRTFSRASSGGTATLSFWVKVAEQDREHCFIINKNGNHRIVNIKAANDWCFNAAGSGFTSYDSNVLARDPSAWYHVLVIQDSSVTSLYINGSQVGSSTSGASGFWNSTGDNQIVIGAETDSGGGSTSVCYFAEYNLLDGTAISVTGGVPDEFGRYNEDGVWVPKDISGLTAAQYGADGFRLVFDSSADGGIGDDSAPTGTGHTAANDFTATGFDTGDIKIYYTLVDTSNSGIYSNDYTSNGPQKIFNGASDNYSSNGAGTLDLDALGADLGTGVSTIVVRTYPRLGTNTITVNTTTATASGNSEQDVTINHDGSAITTFSIAGTDSAYWGVESITVDGTELVDNPNNDVDYLDTPTSNYATLNPLVPSSNRTLANANLQLTMSTDSSGVPATLSVTSGKWYYEVYLQETNSGSNTHIGVVRNVNGASPEFADAIHYRTDFGSIVEFNTQTQSSLTAANDGDIVGVELNLDDDEIAWYVNGTQVGSTESFTSNADDVWSIFLGNGNSGVNKQLDLNFGQMPFIYTQTSGFKAWQTNNLPEPTIKNGKEYFEAVTYAGTGSAQSITGLQFQPDLVWIKKRDNEIESHVMTDVVRGTTKSLLSDFTGPDVTSSNRLTAFNSDGFSVGTDVSVNQSGRNYVAWCWKAGGTAVSNTDGTITSSVSANTDAGFSIVSYTGTGANATVGHGLTEAPDLVIYKDRDASASDWPVYNSTLLSATEYLRLNKPDTKVTGATTAFNSLRPTNTVLNLGSSSLTNSTNDMIAYCWHSVDGFSKINYYQGNGQSEGVFVFLGFKPALLVIKNVSTGDWTVHDAGRFPNNPSSQILRWNTNGQESGTGNDIDLLSNGFKVRNTTSLVNSTGTNYLYIAFAEQPFGGENAPPATAR